MFAILDPDGDKVQINNQEEKWFIIIIFFVP